MPIIGEEGEEGAGRFFATQRQVRFLVLHYCWYVSEQVRCRWQNMLNMSSNELMVFVITGGSSGLGLALAKALAAQRSG